MNKEKRYIVIVGSAEFNVFDYSKRAWNTAKREDPSSYHVEECDFEGVLEFYKECLNLSGEDIYFIDWTRGEVFKDSVKKIRENRAVKG